MFGDEISDYKQLKEIRKQLQGEYWQKRSSLKALFYCGSKVLTIKSSAAVALLANNKTAKFVGNTSCKSPWCCPVCTAKQMAKYAAKIGVAIDALKEQGQYAAMITFTIPHTSGFSCEDATEILYNTWKAFTVHGNKVLATAKNDIFSNFMEQSESKHRVRVTEYTWGNAGWHPHLHCLFWFPREKFQSILDWEEKLNERWLELAKRYTIRQLLLGYPETQRKTVKAKVTTRVNIMYSKLDAGCNGVYISKDKNNKVIKQESSNYICGWGGNREICGNTQEKATHEGHYTWQQILEKAIECVSDAEQVQGAARKWWDLYFEYALATRRKRHARVNFSVHSGICQIIKDYMKTNTYKIAAKKNNTELIKQFGKWRVVCWFTVSQWLSICDNDLEVDILKFAINGGLTEINRLLEAHNIPPAMQNIEAAAVIEEIYNAA